MSPQSTSKKIIQNSRLIVVEGGDDAQFFRQFVRYLGFAGRIHVHDYRGKNNLKNELVNILFEGGFAEVRHLGIVRDADDSHASSFQSIQGQIRVANREKSGVEDTPIPIPPAIGIPFGNDVKTTAFILPPSADGRMLEDVILPLFEDQTAYPCLQVYLDCLAQKQITPTAQNISKMRMQLFLLMQPDRNQWGLTTFIEKGGLDSLWEAEIFNPIRDFITKVANE